MDDRDTKRDERMNNCRDDDDDDDEHNDNSSYDSYDLDVQLETNLKQLTLTSLSCIDDITRDAHKTRFYKNTEKIEHLIQVTKKHFKSKMHWFHW